MPRSKHYAILQSADGARFTFPMKAAVNELDRVTLQFAGGFPAIFGGTAARGGSALQTIQAETAEESRGLLAVSPDAPLNVVRQATVGGDTLTFYWTQAWATTGAVWGPATSFETGEMSGIVTLPYARFAGHLGSPDAILDRLLELSDAPGGTPQQRDQFWASETAAAFVQQIMNAAPVADDPDQG